MCSTRSSKLGVEYASKVDWAFHFRTSIQTIGLTPWPFYDSHGLHLLKQEEVTKELRTIETSRSECFCVFGGRNWSVWSSSFLTDLTRNYCLTLSTSWELQSAKVSSLFHHYIAHFLFRSFRRFRRAHEPSLPAEHLSPETFVCTFLHWFHTLTKLNLNVSLVEKVRTFTELLQLPLFWGEAKG